MFGMIVGRRDVSVAENSIQPVTSLWL